MFNTLNPSEVTRIHGHPRGYRIISIIAVLGLLLCANTYIRSFDPSLGLTITTAGFAGMFAFTAYRSIRSAVVLRILHEAFDFCDPPLSIGEIRFEEIEEIRIFATLSHPMVAFRIRDPARVLARMPRLMRPLIQLVWTRRVYHVAVQLTRLDHQVAAIQSTAARAGIAVRSELV